MNLRDTRFWGAPCVQALLIGRFETSPFNPETHYAVIRSSICTGEKVAGFKDKRDGHFTEVMLIRSVRDEQEFKERYNVDSLRTEY